MGGSARTRVNEEICESIGFVEFEKTVKSFNEIWPDHMTTALWEKYVTNLSDRAKYGSTFASLAPVLPKTYVAR